MPRKHTWFAFLAFFVLVPAVWADTAHDVLFGNGSAGPYSLSWKELAAGTETVRVNSITQTRNLDYVLDAEVGTITFTRPLPPQTAAEVRYLYDPARAVRTNADLTIPLAFDLARGEHGSLSLDAVYKHTGAISDGTAGALAVGLGGGWQTATTRFQTRLLFAPTLTSGPQLFGSDSLARIGLDVTSVTKASRAARFSFGFSRIGTALGPAAGDNNWQAGTETLTLGADLSPSPHLASFVHYTQATVAGVTTNIGDVSVSAQPSTSTQIAASFSTKDAPGKSDDGQIMSLSAQLAPSQVVAWNAAAGRAIQGGVATDHQQISLALSPCAPFHLQTGLLLRQTNQSHTSAATFDGAFQPVSFVQFSGVYTNRMAPPTDAAVQDNLDTSVAQIALTPVRGLRVTGRYAQNPDDGGVPQRLTQRGLGLETRWGGLSVTGGYDWSQQADTAPIGTTLNLGLGVRLSRAVQITGNYKQTLTGVGVSPTGAGLYTVGLTHDLGDRFALSMNGARQQKIGLATPAAPDYTASADLGMTF